MGYNYGSGDVKRFRSVERFTKRSCMVVGILATLLYFVLREPIIRLFIDDDEVVRYGVEMLTAYMLSGPVIGKKTLSISGMHCAGCAQSVTNSLNGIDGVSARVDLDKGRAVVSMDRRIEDAVLIRAVEKEGFRVESIRA